MFFVNELSKANCNSGEKMLVVTMIIKTSERAAGKGRMEKGEIGS